MTRIVWICDVVLMHRLCHRTRYNLLHRRNIYVQIFSHAEIIEFSANPGTWFCALKRSYLFIFCIFCIFYNFNIFSIFFILCTFCIFTFCISCKSFIRSALVPASAFLSLLVSNMCMYIRALLHNPHFATFWQESYRRPPECSCQCLRMTWSKL